MNWGLTLVSSLWFFSGDSDVLRMRALLDDAVNNLEVPQKPVSFCAHCHLVVSNFILRIRILQVFSTDPLFAWVPAKIKLIYFWNHQISVTPKVLKPSSRLARLSAPKQSRNASRQPKKSTDQRPLSLPPTSTAAAATSPRGRSTGLADLVDFSTIKTTTAPLMKRPKVVLPSNVSPRGIFFSLTYKWCDFSVLVDSKTTFNA